jgi:hypothetical protein
VQDAGGVSGELGDLGHGGVLPEAELVLAEAVGGQQLAVVGGPLQGAHLKGDEMSRFSSNIFSVRKREGNIVEQVEGGQQIALEGGTTV